MNVSKLDCLMFVNVSADPVDILIVRVYMPTSDHDENEIDEMYGTVSEILGQEGRGKLIPLLWELSIVLWEKYTNRDCWSRRFG